MPTVELPAGPIDYTDTGSDGPVIVFGHGLLMDGNLWREVIPLLDGYRCIAPTWPLGAHRRPMHADAALDHAGISRIIADFLDALDLSKVTLVLNDWGGGQFIVSEARHDRIGRLVLASCEAYDNFPPKPARPGVALCRLPGGPSLFMQLTRTPMFRRGRQAYGGLAKRGIDDGLLDAWFAPALRDADIRRDLKKFATGTPSREVLDHWHREVVTFDGPVLLLWATEDRMMPVEHARRMADEFSNAKLVEVDDSWTLLPLDQPERVAVELDLFVTAH
ncbi:alpha/beta fold hydrolase [Gordonia sp. PDNC005]|uniref:alpha/beta fold hydrolase n=1 Tax=unclassified Gordonia (in: high G+C Gram-positive bacteria) TaxID=2657482 RepID=UPI001963D211|nr:alpha/beta fold hydrolase [Gordonia sp. PDNC005]QRY61027.1 alpha/beta fold hydrolase [Gordonia sp. PDNC005]